MKTTNNSTITTSWKLEGDYFEECNCKLICPCIFKDNPDEGYCNLTAAWHIQKGNYDKVNLDGLNVVALFHAPGNMLTLSGRQHSTLMKAQVKSNLIYLSKYFLVKQEVFLLQLLILLVRVLDIKSAPIELGTDGKRRWLHIKDSLELEIKAVMGSDPNQEPCVVNPAFSAVPGSNLVVACSTRYRYNGHEMQWNNSGKM
jgi:hypothetical protein